MDDIPAIQKTTVPPPPDAESATAEVTIRTMASDIAMFGQSGGSSPQGESVTVALAPLKGGASSGAASAFKTFFITIAAVLVLGALFSVGYIILPKVLQKEVAPQSPVNTAKNTPSPSLPTSATPTFLGHQSFFKIPPDGTIDVSVGPGAGPLGAQVRNADPAGSMFELQMKNAQDSQPGWTEFLAVQGISLLTSKFWSERFQQDFTAYLWRSGSSSAPGYVLKISSGQNPLTLRSMLQDMEKDPAILQKFFLQETGNATGAFKDSQVSGQPVRVLRFENGSFLYGWFYGNYLILSTSEDGMREVIKRL